MRGRKFGLAGLAGLAAALAGCSIAGEWRTVNTDQVGANFPFYQVTFTEDHRYIAKGGPQVKDRTSTGTYSWNGMELKVTPKDGEPRSYRGYHDALRDRLVLDHEHEGKKLSARLEKVETQAR